MQTTPKPPTHNVSAFESFRRRTLAIYALLAVATVVASLGVYALARTEAPLVVPVVWCFGVACCVLAGAAVWSTLAYAFAQAVELDERDAELAKLLVRGGWHG